MARLTQFRAVQAACPVCGRPLPELRLAVELGAPSADGSTITVDVEPVLDDVWWAAVRDEHAGCLP